jgi:hypothetical protein
MLALLLMQAAPASADVFDDLGAGFNGPSISSDKADYAPGETIVLSGSGWLPGEHVHITVNDDVGQTWLRESDVNADAGGSLSDQFQLPDSFVARYAVTAVGDASGTATTTFTDGNLKVASADGRDFGFTATPYTNTTCSGTGGTTVTDTADANGTNAAAGGNTESVLITANLNANSPNQTAVFSHWTTPGSPTAQIATGYSANNRAVCIVGFANGSPELVGNYVLVTDTTPPTVSSINRANADPTNTAGNVSWTVTFSESVTGVNAADFALVNTGLGGTPAITTVTGSGASYTVTASTGTGSGTLRLNLNDDDSIVDGATNRLGGTGTGSVGSGGAGNGSFQGQLYTIDRAAPTIAATAITLPNPPGNTYVANTWTNQSVRVTFTCTDTGGSGKATDTTATGNTDVTADTPLAGTTVNSAGTCTDNAGNTAAATSFGPVKVDKTAPTITNLGPTSAPDGDNGWYKTDVTNEFRASDSLSGLDSACQTAFPTTVTGGRKQAKTTSGESNAVKVSSSSCTDVAGNTATAIDSAAFKIDKTKPSITDELATTSPNANGWYKTDVVNKFKASDANSGLSTACVAAFDTAVSGGRTQLKTTSGEGSSVKVKSDDCADEAGNTADGIFSAEFKVDKTAPSVAYTSASPAANAAGWNNTNVTATFTATDGLSGFAGPSPTKTGDSVTSGEGEHVTVGSPAFTDLAGNVAAAGAATSAEFKIDKTKPVISDELATTSPNANGWYKTDVLNKFKVSDGGSGLDAACVAAFDSAVADGRTQLKTTSGEGTDVKVKSDDCTDQAGNTADGIFSAEFKIDKHAPTVAYTSASPDANANGWRNTNVTATFTATDNLSGFAGPSSTKTGDSVTSGEGEHVTVGSPAFTDLAGNVAAENTATSAEFKIDKTKPSITDELATTSPNANGWYKTDVVNKFKASDELSGLDADCVTAFDTAVSGGRTQTKTASDEGTGIKVTSDDCTDHAGNTADGIDSAAFKIDKSDPTSSAHSPTATNESTFTVDYTAGDQATLSGLSKVELYVRTPEPGSNYTRVDTDDPASGSGSFEYTPDKGEGTYRFYTLAYDVAGNDETSPVSYDSSTDVETGLPDTTTIFDLTAPITTDDADANWHKDDVEVTLDANDEPGGSGVDQTFYKVDGAASYTPYTTPVLIPADADGSNDGVHTIFYYSTDNAGNEEAFKSATVKIDTTAPTVAYTPPASPDANANGWRNTNVTATFTATDSMSGFSGPSPTKTGTSDTSGEGDNVTVGSPEFTDLAGNSAAAGAAVSPGFKIDKTKPVISNEGATPAANGAGWNNTDVTNKFKASDPLSGLDSACTTAFNTPVTGGRTQTKTTSGEGTAIKVKSDDCTDLAGNKADGIDSAAFKIDKTAPTVTDEGPTSGPNGNNNWYKSNVTNQFRATDNLSGFAGPSSTRTGTSETSGEGEHVTVGSPTFTDLAGNVAAAGAATSAEFKIDKTKPTLAPAVTPNPVVLGGSATVAANASDPDPPLGVGSGVDTQSCGLLTTGSIGTKTVSCTATDKAGWSETKEAAYSVQYGWNGFLQPINDTAHQTGLTQSRFKLGSTVPAKFVLRNTAGQSVQQATNPTFTRTNKLRACDANAVTEPTPTDINPDGGANYSWDGSQYHYNWSTKGIKDTGVYRIYANLADGTQRWVDICLW